MWHSFVHDQDTFLIKFVKCDGSKVLLTNFKKIWCESISEMDLLEKFKDLNPLLDITNEDIESQVRQLVESLTVPTKLQFDDGIVDIEIVNSINENFKVKFNFKLLEMDDPSFFTEMTVPLVHTVQYLELKQKQLLEIIKKKEDEILEYELEKGKISRESKITPKFDPSEFESNESEKLMLKVLTTSSNQFLECFNKNYGNLFEIAPEIKRNVLKKVKPKLKPYVSKFKRGGPSSVSSSKKIKSEDV